MTKGKSLIFLALSSLIAFSCGQEDKRLHSLYKDLPFEMQEVRMPSIPSRSVVLTDFGAVGDGVTLCTDAFAKAFDKLESMGGGRLIVPDGIWFTGPIGLRSKTELHLEDNAIIVFSTDQDLYPIIDTNFEGLDVRRCLSPIHAEGAHDIAITGKGIIDGNGAAWRELKRRKVGDDTWKAMTKGKGVLADDGSVWYPDEGYRKARLTAGSLNKPSDDLDEQEIKTFLRPVLVSFRECDGILLQDVTFQESPAWNIHPLWSRNMIIKDITVRNPHYSTNGDGIDIDACENVVLIGSSFDVGDDAICIKSGKDQDGRAHARKCRNLIIEDCTVYHGHGGFVIGSEMSGGVENIRVRGCRFIGTDVGLRFKSTRGRGGLVKDIWCEDIYMKDIVTYGVIFNLYYAGVAATDLKEGAKEDIQPVDETTPEFRDCHFSGIVCSGAKQAVYINGLPELPVSGLHFKDCIFTAKKGTEKNYAKDVTFENVTVNGKQI
jgi:polygalacturonase